MTMLALFLAFVLLQALDAYTTYRDLQLPGRFEANPVMRWLMIKLGVLPALVAVKILVALLIGWFVYGADLTPMYLIIADLLYGGVVINNWRVGKL